MPEDKIQSELVSKEELNSYEGWWEFQYMAHQIAKGIGIIEV